MKNMYKETTNGFTRWQHAIIIAVLIFIGICSAALLVAIGAQIIKQL